MRYVIYVFGGLVAILAGLFAAALSLDTTERPVPAAVPGFTTFPLEVAHREVPLEVRVFYPTDDSAVEPTLFGQNGLFYGQHVRVDAAPQTGPLPVVVMSHGSGGDVEKMAWLGRSIALSGAIVVATNHPGMTSGDSDPALTLRAWERPMDMTAMLDAMAAAPPLGLEPDMSRVGAVGFSFGGYAVLALSGVPVSKEAFIDYCETYPDFADCGWYLAAGLDFETVIEPAAFEANHGDARIISTVAIDPALTRAVRMDDLSAFTAQTLFLNLGTAAEIEPAALVDALPQVAANAGYAAIPKAHHFSALTECSALGVVLIGLAGEDNICSDQGVRPRAEVHRDILMLTHAHFAQTLGTAPVLR